MQEDQCKEMKSDDTSLNNANMLSTRRVRVVHRIDNILALLSDV